LAAYRSGRWRYGDSNSDFSLARAEPSRLDDTP
jgi:hypothetical protein